MSRHSTTLNDPLTPREAQILASIVAGRQNKETARDLGISPRTVEVHRGNIMTKIGARTLADMVRIAIINPPTVKVFGTTAVNVLGAVPAGDRRFEDAAK